ncbi:MAG: hypothetical protein J4F43_02305 [Dehalococcoidia bacterium]|nr:hypothetical protein [Dehalococcoidia bacterium]
MSTLSQMPKPDAERFRKGRKLYLVPLFVVPMEVPDDLGQMLDRYWTGSNGHIASLESALGPVSRIYHETVFLPGEEGAKLVEQINPRGYGMLRQRLDAGAHLEALEEQVLVEESTDWQRCLTVGLVSQKVTALAMQSYIDVTGKRYESMASKIDETLEEDESAILLVGDNHRVQFPSDIEVFYVSPPALNEIRRWIDDQMNERSPAAEESGDPPPTPAEAGAEGDAEAPG